MEGLWVPIVMFIAIAVVVSVWLHFRHRTRAELQKTVQLAIEKGQELSPELLDRLGQPRTSGHVDLRRGVIFLGIGVAFVIFAFLLNQDDAFRPLLGVAAFPSLLGVAYLTLWRFAGNKEA